MKNCCLFMEYSDEPPRCLPYRLPNKKSPLKSVNLRDFEVPFSSHHQNPLIKHYCESRLLTTVDLNISHLKNTCKDRRKVKDAMLVRKIDLCQKESLEMRKASPPPPSLLKRATLQETRSQLSSQRRKHCSISPYPYLKRNETEGNMTAFPTHIHVKSLKNPNKTTKLENIFKRDSERNTLPEKPEKLAPVPIKNDSIPNAKLTAYLNFIKEQRRLHNMSEEALQTGKKRNLRVRIKKGNNSVLIRDLFKKRWWWSIDEDKDSKGKCNFTWSQLKDKNYFTEEADEGEQLSHNHFSQNEYLGNKKALFYNMSHYYTSEGKNVFDYLPLTFHVQELGDEAWQKFALKYKELETVKENNIWILKPGENSNRGKGITVHKSYAEIEQVIAEGGIFTDLADNSIKKRTYIIQEYIDRPFLYNRRKFDIRCYMLLVNIGGSLKGYWYKDGYIRTSSFEFQLANLSSSYVHLTNDAIQNNSENYGKYEDGNKLSYPQFQKYLDTKHAAAGYDFEATIIPKMKEVALHSIRASHQLVRGSANRPVFEVFGLDFMIDEGFQPWLIEINTNPCIETSCLVLEKVIPKMLDDAFKLTIDVLFPPPDNWPSSRRHSIPSPTTSFELIFEEQLNPAQVQPFLDFPSLGVITEDQQVYEQK